MKKHLVFMIGDITPQVSANSKIISSLLEEINDDIKVTVIHKNNFQEFKIQDNISYYQIMTKYDNMKLKIAIKSEKRNGLVHRIMKFKAIIERVFQAIFSFPYYFRDDVNTYLKAIDTVNSKDKIDFLIPVCFPFETIVSANKSNIEYIPILFDKVSTNLNYQRSRILMRLKMKSNLLLEKKIIKKSVRTITTNDYYSFMKENNLLDKVEILKIPSYIPKNNTFYKHNSLKGFLYGGTITKKNRNPSYSVRIMKEVVDNLDETFTIYGNSECDNLIAKCSQNNNKIIKREAIKPEEFEEEIHKCKILVSIGNKDITQTPSKIFEYISFLKPIIHFSKSEQDPINEIINDYPLGLVVIDNKFPDVEVVSIIVNFYKNIMNHKNIVKENIDALFKEYTPKYFMDKIIELINMEENKNV